MNNRHRQVAKWNAYYANKRAEKLLNTFLNAEEAIRNVGNAGVLTANTLRAFFDEAFCAEK